MRATRKERWSVPPPGRVRGLDQNRLTLADLFFDWWDDAFVEGLFERARLARIPS